MRTQFLAAAAAFALLPAQTVLGDAMQAHDYAARRAAAGAAATISPHQFRAQLAMRGAEALYVSTAGASAAWRPVYVDGVLLKMDEAAIRGQIASGTFTVVYPGTEVPWQSGGTGNPGYPPLWY